MEDTNTHAARTRMVKEQLEARGITSAAVLKAMGTVPRELFAHPDAPGAAYTDSPIAIGEGQTISQPFIVALMVQALALAPGDVILEVGTGSGYAAAVLSLLCRHVHTMERHESLAVEARERHRELGYHNISVHVGDGSLGLVEHGPFDAITVAAGGPVIPDPLLGQLTMGGRLVMPVGPKRGEQFLTLVVREAGANFVSKSLCAVSFVPLIGERGWPDESEART